jgi:DNA primase
VYDRFRGRLVWPIRDLSGDTIGFGARRLFDDDDGPKYLNTPETLLYKKSQVLYGIDLARKAIGSQQQAVVVEGYTDVMACHLAGVGTAVATCGTAFGSDHIKVLRRLLMDDDTFTGEVVFTFDGDAAGQKAALRAFDDDQRFVAATFVAVEAHGLDPCDLRLQQGDEAVRSLVSHRVPMFEFAIRSTLATHDLDTAEGRVAALRDAAPVVARIRDQALRPEYARLLAGWLGIDLKPVREAVARAERGGGRGSGGKADRSAPRPPSSGTSSGVSAATEQEAPRPSVVLRPDPRSLPHHVEREALKAALQRPAAVVDWFDVVEDPAFTFPPYATAHGAVVAAGGTAAGASLEPQAWVDAVLAACPDDSARSLVTSLVVEPLRVDEGESEGEAEDRYAVGIVARLLELDAARRIEELRGRLTRLDPVADPAASETVFRDLLALEQYRRELREQAVGEG